MTPVDRRGDSLRRHRAHSAGAVSGFTLLELMLALVLMVGLLALTWSLLSFFTQRLERAQAMTERRHVTRALHLMLDADLRNGYRFGTTTAAPQRSERPSLSLPLDSPVLDTAAAAPSLDDETNPPPAAGDPARFGDLSPERTALGAAATTTNIGVSLGREDETLLIDRWKSTDRLFVGTSQLLMFDTIPPANPGRSTKPAEAPSLDRADVPDVVHRVVYVFTDPLLPNLTDRPTGLTRCDLSPWQVLQLSRTWAEAADLMSLLRPTIIKLKSAAPEVPDLTLRLRTDVPEAARTSEAPAEPATSLADDRATQVQSADATELAGADRAVPARDDPWSLGQSVDYLPEIATFRLRYYDGQSWSTSWDSQQRQGQWPRAVEIRFQFADELQQLLDRQGDNAVTGQSLSEPSTTSPASMDASAPDAIEPPDDELRSAQTAPVQDHRYLIVLQPQPQRAVGPTARDASSPGDEELTTPNPSSDSDDALAPEFAP